MQRPSHELKQAESAIHTVIESLIDSQEALVEIGEKLQDQTLRHYLLAESLKRAQFRGELESILNQEGVSGLRESGTPAGAVHRAWANLKSRLGGGDHTLLATATEGEDAAREVYDNAINTSMPLPIRQVLTSQAAHIQESHEFLKAALGHTGEHAA
jgi:uncharacterized protein (TIGR02284 family)